MGSNMYERNLEIREAKGKIPYWMIAEVLGVSEGTLQRWMRKEMSVHKKEEVMDAIIKIKNEMNKNRLW